jgi:SAM-dependent methyltransferase
MSVLEQAKLPPDELDGAKRARDELDRIFDEHGICESDLQIALQRATWDASADAKAARAMTGKMPPDVEERVDAACRIVAEACCRSGSGDGEGKGGRCLDVGCGYGALVPSLRKAGLGVEQIVGVDLSPEMIRNAREQHPGVDFVAADFLKDGGGGGGEAGFAGGPFRAVVFCASLHDLPNARDAIARAATLLETGGKVVVAHPQGASHVLRQSSANPALVPRGLPDADELRTVAGELGCLELVVEPAPAGSVRESDEGYLAVLEKK